MRFKIDPTTYGMQMAREKLTLEALADRLEMTKAGTSLIQGKIENGMPLTVALAGRIAAALNIAPEQLGALEFNRKEDDSHD